MIKHFKRTLALLMVAIIAITGSGLSAFAVSSGETVYISTTPRAQQNSDTGTDNAYAAGVYWHNSNVSVRFITTRVGSSQTRTDTYVYCIEPGATFVNNTYTANPVSGSTFWNNLSPDAQKVISYATMYGFPVNQFGVSKCDAYAATQAIIWEACYGYRTTAGRTNNHTCQFRSSVNYALFLNHFTQNTIKHTLLAVLCTSPNIIVIITYLPFGKIMG